MVWEPLKRVGPFIFDSSLEDLPDSISLEKVAELDPVTNQVRYEYGSGAADVYIENGLIETIGCCDSCVFEGVELIGKSLDLFERTVNCNPSDPVEVIDLETGSQEVVGYDSVGAQVWVLNNIVNSISCWS